MIKNSRKLKSNLLKAQTLPSAAVKPAPAIEKSEPIKAAVVSKPEPVKATAAAIKPAPPRVCLELVQPQAKSVFVAGSFNQWKPDQVPMTLKGNGRWVGDLAVPPGKHEYLFVVDGQWLPDPNAREFVQNPFGGKNSVLTVSE